MVIFVNAAKLVNIETVEELPCGCRHVVMTHSNGIEEEDIFPCDGHEGEHVVRVFTNE